MIVLKDRRHLNINTAIPQEKLRNLTDAKVYDSSFPPNYEENIPTTVMVNIIITSFDSVDQVNMDYSVSFHLRQVWEDKRLVYDSDVVGLEFLEVDAKTIKSIWVPDIYFTDEREGLFHEITVANRLMHISADGNVTYSMRLSLKMGCNMQIQNFPHDIQTCSITMESYTYTSDNVKLRWGAIPVKMPELPELPQFTVQLQNDSALDTEREYLDSGNRTRLNVDFKFHRKVGYYVIQVYVPNLMIVVLSWVSFWLDIDAVPARVCIGILTVLTLTTMSSGIGQSLPRVSYIKAIDIWSFVCLFYVFSALLEYAYVNVLSRVQKRRSFISQATMKGNEDGPIAEQNGLKPRNGRDKESFVCKYRRQKARAVDKIARIVFPVTFIIFCSVYFLVFTLRWMNQLEE